MKSPVLAPFLAAALPLLASCGPSASPSSATPPQAATPDATPDLTPDASAAKLYPAQGVVRGFQSDDKVIVIHNKDIPGFMDEMTMPYELQDPALAKGLKAGDAVDFTITAQGDDDIITAIQKRRP